MIDALLTFGIILVGGLGVMFLLSLHWRWQMRGIPGTYRSPFMTWTNPTNIPTCTVCGQEMTSCSDDQWGAGWLHYWACENCDQDGDGILRQRR